MKSFVVALDQGTTSSRALVFDKKGFVVASQHKEHQQIFPRSGWVEHNPEEILKNQISVFVNLLKKHKISAKEISSIGITNQRETVVVWEKKTGHSVYNAIVWQDKRTSSFCKKIIRGGCEKKIKQKTGLVVDTYFSASKINWILSNIPNGKSRAKKGDLLAGTIDSWLLWHLTNQSSHLTDYTNASRTLLFNIKDLQWDDDLLAIFDIPKNLLPKAKPSSSFFGSFLYNDVQIPITGICGDQQSALFGQQCFEKGEAKSTFGTGCFLLLNCGKKFTSSSSGLLTTLGCSFTDKPIYALEGSVFIGGAALRWLRENLNLISSEKDSEKIASNLKESEIVVVPAFSGLGAPHWNMSARGGIFGLSLSTTKNEIVKATLESLAYQTKDLILAMEKDIQGSLKNLKVDGGVSKNNYLMQFQSDILNCNIIRPKNTECTALGVAFLAGLKVGFWNEKKIRSLTFNKRVFVSNISDSLRKKRSNLWSQGIDLCKNWLKK